MRRTVNDAFMTIGSVLALVLALVALDDNVRTQVAQQLSANPATALVTFGERAQEIAAILIRSAQTQSLAHTPLVLFSIAGVVLVLFMLRT
jgi:hypothetical protein